MATQIKDGGTWRSATGIHVKDGGVWRSSSTVHIKDAGTWRQVFSSATPDTFTVPATISGPGTWSFVTNGALSFQPTVQHTFVAQGPYNLRIRAWGGGGQPNQGYPSGAGGFAGGYLPGTTGDTLIMNSNFGVVGPSPGGGAYGVFASSVSQANARVVAGGGGATDADDGGRGQVAGAGGGTSGQPGSGYQSTSGGGPGYTVWPLQGGPGAGYGGGSGGGSGYWGGQGGPDICCLAATGGGGGSSYVHPTVTSPSNLGGSRGSVGNPSDPVRGSAGEVGTLGRLYLST